jgi:RNA polymerase sigma-70 factor (ECF subfamily)
LAGGRDEFERLVLPHLGAAYDLARWLMRHPQDAEDATQEAVIRAFRAFDRYAGGSARGWLLAIVRNTCMTRLKRLRSSGKVVVLQDVIDEIEMQGAGTTEIGLSPRPDQALLAHEDRERVHRALAALPEPYREIVVLREFDELTYAEIARIVGVPTGTVMSRLARARARLCKLLAADDHSAAPMRPGRKDHD